MNKLIVHVADVKIAEEAGVGRVIWHWKNAFEARGYEFLHIGLKEVPPVPHKSLFGFAASRYYRNLGRQPCIFFAHESVAVYFVNQNSPVICFSHGLERRAWEIELKYQNESSRKIPLRTKLLYPIWRLGSCDLGMRRSTALLMPNQEDAAFAQNYYRRDPSQVFVMKNGVYPSQLDETVQPKDKFTVLFLASWIERKGIKTLLEAAQILNEKGLQVNWLLVGTSVGKEKILPDWPTQLHSSVEVIPTYRRAEEENIYARSNIFILPSLFEGQPLALLQAMESGRCCITTDAFGQRDVIQHGYNGLLHEPGNAQQLASLIEECANNEEFRTSLGRNAKLSMQNRSWKTVAGEVVDLSEEILLNWQKIKGVQ